MSRLVPAIARSITRLIEINQASARVDTEVIASIHERGLWIDAGIGLVTLALALVIGLALVQSLTAQRRLFELHAQELEAFAGRAAHDLRGPLAPIGGYAELLEREPTPIVGAYAKKIRSAVIRMHGIIDDLFALSISGRPRPGCVPVACAIRDAVVDLGTELADADVVVRCDDGVAAMSAGVLAQVLHNLIGNAAKYREPTRRLALSIHVPERAERWRSSSRTTGSGCLLRR